MGRISPELVLVDPDLGELLRELLPEPGDCLAPRPRPRLAVALPVTLAEPVALPRSVTPPPRETKRRSRARRLAWVAVAALLASPLLAFVNVTDYPPAPALQGGSPPASPPAAKAPTTVDKKPVASKPETAKPKQASTPERKAPPPPKAKPAPATKTKPAVRPTRKTKSSPTPATIPRKTRPSPKRPRATTKAKARTSTRPDAVIRWPRQRTALFYSVILVRPGERIDFRAPTNVAEFRSEGARSPAVYHWFVYPAFGSALEPAYGRLVADGTVRLAPGSIRLR